MNLLNNNNIRKIENKIQDSTINAPVQQAEIIINQVPVDRADRISESAKSNLVDALKGLSSEDFKVFSNSGDPEAERLSRALIEILGQADWKCLGHIVNLGGTYSDGLSIKVKEVNAARQLLADWFKGLGFRVQAHKNGVNDLIEIFIGRNN